MTEPLDVVYHYQGGPEIRLLRVGQSDGRYVHWLEVQRGRPGVVVIPTDGARVLLQRQYRIATQEWLWQFPRGFGGGDVLEDAARELHEETGMSDAALRDVGQFRPDAGLLAGTVFVVEARVDGFPARFHAPGLPDEPRELIDDYALLRLAELDEWAASGRLLDGLTLAALQLWRVAQR